MTDIRGELPSFILVEDSEDDEMLIMRTIDRSNWHGNVQVARDGAEARALFDRTFGALPQLILMDLNVRQASGYELLDFVRSRPVFSSTPLVIFATSPSEEQVAGCYAHGANAVVEKPLAFGDVKATVDCIISFWLQCNRLPKLRSSAQQAATSLS